MNRSPLAARKLIVGLVALACLATAGSLWLFTADAGTNPVTAVTTKLGLMLAALWLALPTRGESVGWEKALPPLIGAIAVLALIGRNSRILIFALPAAILAGIALAFLRPRSKRRRP